jgi:peroxiredoxin
MSKAILSRLTIWVLAAVLLAPHVYSREAVIGEKAPDFRATDSNGKTQNLASYKGKIVVLEWLNRQCPFVRKHYDSGNMQKLQKEYTGKGVIWFSVISSAPGKQGYCTPEEANSFFREKGAAATAVLLDTQGTVGKLYGAKTTPHMFIIDAAGVLVYDGAIDDTPSTNIADIATAKNYVQSALDEILAGKQVTVATSQPYGCSVKY